MLTDYCLKRHFKILPPPKSIDFFLGGGGKAFWIKSSIFESGWYKKFWQDFGADRTLLATFWPIIGQYQPKTHNWNFENMAFLSILRHFQGLFFSKSNFGPKWPKNDSKWFFRASLGPKDDLDWFLIKFW